MGDPRDSPELQQAERYTLDSTLDSIEKIEHLVLDYALRMGFKGASLEQISLAVHETAANAVFHGNQENADKKVFLEISAPDGHLKIVITDQGCGFDPAKIPDPLGPEEMFRERGRGIYLTRALMDEYRANCSPDGSEITMVKYR
ncbi:MAG TPA: ATP-binding protein [Bryobacteraceae bacterium]|nr:ATP-binding protein [Bryobacteraceae bacterium]